MAGVDKETSNVQADFLFCLFLIVLLVVFFVAAMGYKPVTRHAPMVVMVPLAVMLAGQIAMLVKKFRHIRHKNEKIALLPRIEREKLLKAAQLLIWMVVLIFLIYLVGQVFGIALFLIAFLRFASRERWVLSIILGITVTAGLHVLFEVILKISLFQGIIFKYVSGMIGT